MNEDRMNKNSGRIICFIFALFVIGRIVCCPTVCAADIDEIKKNRVFQVSSDVELHVEPDLASEIAAMLPGGTPVIIKEDVQDGWCKVAYREQMGYVQISFLATVGSPVTSTGTVDQAAADSGGQTQNPIVHNGGEQTEDSAVRSSEALPEDQAAQNDQVQPENESIQNELQTEDHAAQNDQVQTHDEITTAGNTDALKDEFKVIQEQNLLSYQEAEIAKEQAKADRIWGIVIALLVIAIFAVGVVTTLSGNKGKKKG